MKAAMPGYAKNWKDRSEESAQGELPSACPLPSGPEPPPEQQEAWQAALAAGRCLHCEGDLGQGWREEEGPFCCRGCRSVFELIHGRDLGRYYDLRQGPQAPAPSLRGVSFAWLDRLLEEESADRSESDDEVLRLHLEIQGVHCAACVWLLEELFTREAGGIEIRINPGRGEVDLSWDPAAGDLRGYLAEVERFGYRLGPARPAGEGGGERSRGLLFRLALTAAIALNVMMFSISFYFGLAPEDGRLFQFFGLLNLGLATVSVLVGGPVFFRGALAGLRRGVTHLDLPISLGMTLAYAGSVFAYFSLGPRAAYFDSLTVFVALMLMGRWAQERILERNRNSLLSDSGVEGITAKRRDGEGLTAMAASELRTGDELWIAPGDLLPLEGILLRRRAEASLDWITGESDLVAYEPGDRLPAGAFNAGRQGFAVAASQDFGDSRLGDLLRSGDGDAAFRPTWWHRVSSVYVLAVLILAGGAFLTWAGRDLRLAIEVTISVLVITCPCALGLATPLAEELVHVALRRRGVFLRRASFLEKALRVRKVLLDKTGTLTLGRLALEAESRKALWALDGPEQALLWNLCARSNHPVSRSLAEALAAGGKAPALDGAADELEEHPGQGLLWRRPDGEYRLGRPEFAGAARPAEAEGLTHFSRDGELLAAFRFSETYKGDAAAELATLRRQGYELHLLSGDAESKTARAAAALGIASEQALGGLDPEAKAARVRKLDAGDTLMVGDGINDSPSFEAALCSATPAVDRPVLPGKADFYFLGDGIGAIRRALAAAGRLRRVTRDNLIFAIVYNLAAVALCFAGLVSPVVAAILMPVSSITVVSLTAWRLSGRRLTWMS
jgi:P-type Cu2+ transporter